MPNLGTTYRTAAYECDQNGVLQLGTIFNWLQDSMDQYSQRHKLGHDFCKEKNLTYMLKGYDVKIDSLPKWTDSVVISTDLVDTTACSLFFNQRVSDTHREKDFLSSVSHIVLIDLLRNKPARVSRNIPLQNLEIKPMDITDNLSLPPLDTVHEERIQEITNDCIDFNQHVNNTNYVVFAERSLDLNLFKKEKLRRIQVAYKQAAVLSDKIKVETRIGSDMTEHQIVSIADPNKHFARIRFLWEQNSRQR